MEQYITELANDIAKSCPDLVENGCGNDNCVACLAFKLIGLGYKKQTETADVAPKSEVAREIFEEIEKIIDKHHGECYEYEDGDECDTAITYISYISCDIDELKKKYTEEKE